MKDGVGHTAHRVVRYRPGAPTLGLHERGARGAIKEIVRDRESAGSRDGGVDRIGLCMDDATKATKEITPEDIVIGRHPWRRPILVRRKGGIGRRAPAGVPCVGARDIHDVALEQHIAAVLHFPDGFRGCVETRAPLGTFRDGIPCDGHSDQVTAAPLCAGPIRRERGSVCDGVGSHAVIRHEARAGVDGIHDDDVAA